MNKYSLFAILLLFVFNISCTHTVPEKYKYFNEQATIYPDYTNLTIPVNIAPLNFSIEEEGTNFITKMYSKKGTSLQANGKTVQWNLKQWHQLLSKNSGDTLYIDIFIERNKRWVKYSTLKNYISPYETDPYISYRLIEPSYSVYEQMTINQRNLTNFEEEIIYNNSTLSEDENGHCINCHAFQDYNRSGKMQFHLRHYKGGTIITNGNTIKKVNLKTDYTISAGVYPAWHPSEDLIAYSVNNTEQHFLKKGKQKVEVIDSKSDLILYNLANDEIINIANDSTKLETFPAWAPDGRSLYYASANYPLNTSPGDSLIDHYKNFNYNISRKFFDPALMSFSQEETVFDASAIGKSATFPRVSPNGRYLLFTLADYGNFHIWHDSSNLHLLDLKTGKQSPLKELNSNKSDSYHCWSSNGHWIIFSSRRENGSYTRFYISYFENGVAGKPFVVPQEKPNYYAALFKSYNVPEFMVKPVRLPKHKLLNTINDAPVNVFFSKQPVNHKITQEKTIKPNFYN